METYINPGMPSKPRFSANRRTRQRPHRLSHHIGTCPDRVSRGSDVRVGIARDMPPKLFEDQRRLVVGACAERVVKVGCGWVAGEEPCRVYVPAPRCPCYRRPMEVTRRDVRGTGFA